MKKDKEWLGLDTSKEKELSIDTTFVENPSKQWQEQMGNIQGGTVGMQVQPSLTALDASEFDHSYDEANPGITAGVQQRERYSGADLISHVMKIGETALTVANQYPDAKLASVAGQLAEERAGRKVLVGKRRKAVLR